jgi:hypothetical protein
MSRSPFLSFQCTECSSRIRQSRVAQHVACPGSRFRCAHCRATLASLETAERHYCARFALAKNKWLSLKYEEEKKKKDTVTTVFAAPPFMEDVPSEEPALDAIVMPDPDVKPSILKITWPATWIASKTCPGCETMFPTTCMLATHLYAFRTHLPRDLHPRLTTCGLHTFGTRCPNAEQAVPFVFWEDA